MREEAQQGWGCHSRKFEVGNSKFGKPGRISNFQCRISWLVATLVLGCATLASASIPRIGGSGSAAAPTNAPGVVEFSTNAPPEVQLPLTWHPAIDAAVLEAEANDRPILIFFRSSACGWCERLRLELEAQELRPLLQGFARAEINVDRDRAVATKLRIESVPVLLIAGPDGRELQRISGYLPASQLRTALTRALKPGAAGKAPPELARRLEQLEAGRLPEADWPALLAVLGEAQVRDRVRGYVAAHAAEIRGRLVPLLRHRELAVRLGALELLEEIGGETFGYDPWGVPLVEANSEALHRWETWQTQGEGTNALYTALPAARLAAYLNDLVGTDRDRAQRAARALAQAGGSCRDALDRFLAEHRDLAEGPRKRVQEVRLAVQIPPVAGLDAGALAHHLMFGTADMRMKALDQLGRAGRLASPVILAFVADPDPLIRAAAIEALVKAGGPDVTGRLVERAQVERDPDVQQTILLALGKKPGMDGGALVMAACTNANENLAVTALGGLANVPDGMAARAVLKKALFDPRWRVRVAALEAANRMRPENLASRIEAMVRDPDAFVRISAVKALVAVRRKDALETLEGLFLENDELKPTIAGTYLELEKAFPEKFAPALQGKPVELILGVLSPIKDKGKARHAPLALAFVNHADADVACTALRVLATIGSGTTAGRAALIQALRAGSPDRQLAVLENLHLPRVDGRAARGMRGEDFEPAQTITDSPTPAASSPAPSGNADVDALFQAFGSPATAGAATAAPVRVAATAAPPASVARDTTADDLFGAFQAGAPAAAAPVVTEPAAAAAGTADTLTAEVRALLQRSPDARVRCEAAMVLATAGANDGVLHLAGVFDTLDARQRETLASALPGAGATNSLPLLRRLLRDASAEVRNDAAGAALDSRSSAFFDVVLSELSAPDALLQPQDLSLYRFREVVTGPQARGIHRWALRFIAPRQREPIRVTGFLLIEEGRDAADAELLEGYLKDSSALVRRAAYHALAWVAPDTFLRHAAEAARDSSPLVREVVPAHGARITYEDRWLVRFSENAAVPKGDYTSEGIPLTPELEKLLRGLLADVDANVSVGAAVALLEARRSVDLARVGETLAMLPPGHRARELLTRYMMRNARSLGSAFRVLIPYLDGSDERAMNEIETALANRASGTAPEAEALFLSRPEAAVTNAPTIARPAASNAPAPAIRLVFFHQTGCRDCERTRRWLEELQRSLPRLEVEEHNIALTRAKELNEALGRRFHVPEGERLVAPAVFGGAGALTRGEITFDRLAALAVDSSRVPLAQWYPADERETREASAEIVRRGRQTGLPLVVIGGLLDGINPCAFATLIFFISYLQIMRRRPVELLQVGVAFVAGVFVSYLAIGLGLREVVGQLTALRGVTLGVNGAIALLTLVLAFLNLRDGVRCRQGRLGEMTLQLPTVIKKRIHATVREGMKVRGYVLAAFVTAVLVSLLELVCTGQGYLPVITYLWQVGYDRLATIGLLVVYNIAFVLPLVAVFVLAYRGLRSDALLRALNRHAATVKFATAGLFAFLFALIAWQVWRML
jgi:HEAT repeat protein/glutaredoxin